MDNLQFLAVYSGWPKMFSSCFCLPEGLNCLPNKLRLIHWDHCPMRFWPSKFSGKFLVEIYMRESKLEKLWEGIEPLQCLKWMNLSESENLQEISDLSKATNLEDLNLWFCSGLLELTNSIGNATKLKRLDLMGCRLLKELPFSIGNCTNLQFLNLGFCESLEKLPSSIDRLTNLVELQLTGCKELVFPTNMKLDSLSKIDLQGYTLLKTFSDISTNVKKLDLGDTAIEEVPSSISSWSSLERLDMSECRNLKKFPNVPDSIVELKLSNTGIEEIPPWIENLFRLCKLTMRGCKKLKIISPNISKLQNLQFLDSSNCESLRRIDWSFENPKICLNFSGCFNLNQEARELILTSACKYAILPGVHVPELFTHQATSASLTINFTPKPNLSFFKFKACILLSQGNFNEELRVSWRVRSKQNGIIVGYGENTFNISHILRYTDHLYIFDNSFYLDQDCPEAKEATLISELVFEFLLRYTTFGGPS